MNDKRTIRLEISNLTGVEIEEVENADYLMIGESKFTSRDNAAELCSKLVNDAVNARKYGIPKNITTWLSYLLWIVGLLIIAFLIIIHLFGGSFTYSVEQGAIETVRSWF